MRGRNCSEGMMPRHGDGRCQRVVTEAHKSPGEAIGLPGHRTAWNLCRVSHSPTLPRARCGRVEEQPRHGAKAPVNADIGERRNRHMLGETLARRRLSPLRLATWPLGLVHLAHTILNGQNAFLSTEQLTPIFQAQPWAWTAFRQGSKATIRRLDTPVGSPA